jgi:hypothetical protein
MKKIIHKYIMKKYGVSEHFLVGYNYLCNWAVEADYRKTDISNHKVNCLNCKKIIKRFNRLHPGQDITKIKLIEGCL